MRKIWDKVANCLASIGIDKWMHFCFGLIIAAFFCLVLGISWCFIPALIIGLLKEVFDYFTTRLFDWWDLLVTALGGILIQIFVII